MGWINTHKKMPQWLRYMGSMVSQKVAGDQKGGGG